MSYMSYTSCCMSHSSCYMTCSMWSLFDTCHVMTTLARDSIRARQQVAPCAFVAPLRSNADQLASLIKWCRSYDCSCGRDSLPLQTWKPKSSPRGLCMLRQVSRTGRSNKQCIRTMELATSINQYIRAAAINFVAASGAAPRMSRAWNRTLVVYERSSSMILGHPNTWSAHPSRKPRLWRAGLVAASRGAVDSIGRSAC
jgi:hypothetical protein